MWSTPWFRATPMSGPTKALFSLRCCFVHGRSVPIAIFLFGTGVYPGSRCIWHAQHSFRIRLAGAKLRAGGPGTNTNRYRQHSADNGYTSGTPVCTMSTFLLVFTVLGAMSRFFGHTKTESGHMSKFLYFFVSPAPCTYNIVHGRSQRN